MMTCGLKDFFSLAETSFHRHERQGGEMLHIFASDSGKYKLTIGGSGKGCPVINWQHIQDVCCLLTYDHQHRLHPLVTLYWVSERKRMDGS